MIPLPAENSSAGYCAVVGGVNVDIGGKSFAPLLPRDSNPGTVSVSLGGVGRNIAHNLSRLGVPVGMLTAFGKDLYGQKIEDSCAELGIDVSRAIRPENVSTSTYLFVADADGDMALAVSDMAICDRITPDYIKENLSFLQGARLVVADANVPADTLRFLADSLTVPLFCDPVSVTKAKKLRPILSKIHTLKPNRLEAECLTGVSVSTLSDAEKAAKSLLSLGVRRVFLSLGGDGMVCADEKECFHLPCIPGNAVNTTGCGDAAMAAVIWAFTEDLSLRDTASAALYAGALTRESYDTISPRINSRVLSEFLRKEQV